MRRPALLISAGKELFGSFFSPQQQRRLSGRFQWTRQESAKLNPEFQRELISTEALITTWDSPAFGDDLLRLAPQLRVIAHCGGEVKSRFSRSLFKRLTITNAPLPWPALPPNSEPPSFCIARATSTSIALNCASARAESTTRSTCKAVLSPSSGAR